jgi:hypothetical protein
MAGTTRPLPSAGGSWLAKAWHTVVNWVRQESAATQVLITAFIALGISFQWWHWTNAETGAVVGIVTAVLGMFVRSQVTPLVRPTISERHARDVLVERHLAPEDLRPAAPVGGPGAGGPGAGQPPGGPGFGPGQPPGGPGFGPGQPPGVPSPGGPRAGQPPGGRPGPGA